jgi:hypothetical protein
VTRTTGPRSQNKLIHGGCADIAVQIGEPKALVYQVICLEAATENIIPVRVVMGMAVPDHESNWTTKQAADVKELLNKRVAMLAQQYGRPFYLTVYGPDGFAEKEWTRP